jgi:hypothetical protein
MQGERFGWGAPGSGGRGGCGGSWVTWESVAIFDSTVSAASGSGVLDSGALARLLSLLLTGCPADTLPPVSLTPPRRHTVTPPVSG